MVAKNQTQQTQEEIREWFDNMYKWRAGAYLRPTVAYHVFMSILGVEPNKKLLDVACGPGQLLKVANENNLELAGVDIAPTAIQKCKAALPNADVHVGNAEALPFEDNTFDYVTCIGSLERFLNREKALKEQQRVAKADAKFCIMVRNNQTVSWRLKKGVGLQNDKGHQDAKNLSEWRQMLESNGFEVLGVYHDHYPALRLKRWLSLGLAPINYGKIRTPLLPIEYAEELIFLLKKAKG